MAKYPNGSIYLSGGMQYAPALGTAWRRDCAKRIQDLGFKPIDIAALDGLYTEEHGAVYQCLKDEELLQRKANVRRHFVDTDVKLVRLNSDALIVLYDESVRRGAGTTSEIHEAFMNDIPVFLVNTYPNLSDISTWMQAETTKIFSNFDDLYLYLESLPQGILKRDVYGNRRSGNYYLCSLCGEVEEKHGSHFVSNVSPSYCKSCVEIVKTTHEVHADRYEFCNELLRKD